MSQNNNDPEFDLLLRALGIDPKINDDLGFNPAQMDKINNAIVLGLTPRRLQRRQPGKVADKNTPKPKENILINKD